MLFLSIVFLCLSAPYVNTQHTMKRISNKLGCLQKNRIYKYKIYTHPTKLPTVWRKIYTITYIVRKIQTPSPYQANSQGNFHQSKFINFIVVSNGERAIYIPCQTPCCPVLLRKIFGNEFHINSFGLISFSLQIRAFSFDFIINTSGTSADIGFTAASFVYYATLTNDASLVECNKCAWTIYRKFFHFNWIRYRFICSAWYVFVGEWLLMLFIIYIQNHHLCIKVPRWHMSSDNSG